MTTSQKIHALVLLIRPELPLAAGICVVVGQVIALGYFPPLGLLSLGFFLGFFLSSSAMVFNDIFDQQVDQINAPHRPLPQGLLTQNEAVIFGIATTGVALLIAWIIQPLAFILSLGVWVIGFLYNWKLKSAGLWGNLIVSTSVAMTIVMGGVSVGQPASPLLLTFAFITFFFDLAEEIAGDAMDMAGDRERSSQSIAILYGKKTALRISASLFILVIILTLLPLAWGLSAPHYWLPIAVMDILVIFFTARLLQSHTPQEGRRAMRGMYISATLCLLAFLLSAFL